MSGVAAIRTRGRRLTAQRSLIWDALVERGDAHVSAAELAEAVWARAPEVHRSTVYRTLDVLVEDGLVLRTDLGGDRGYYELAAEAGVELELVAELPRLMRELTVDDLHDLL